MKPDRGRASSLAAPEDVAASVYLKSTWVVCSLRHPALRLIGCLAHLVACFFLCSSSPLLASTKSRGSFPVYGDWVATICTGVTWVKLLFHVLLSVAIATLLRLVAYRKLVQHAWNWRGSYRRATRTFSRLSGVDERELAAPDATNQREEYARAMNLRVFTSRVTGKPTLAVHVANDATQTQGSWTFMALGYPICWWLCVSVLRLLVGIDADTSAGTAGAFGRLLVAGDGASSWRQLDVQRVVHVAVMTLSALKLVVTLDLALQDRNYARTLYSNWLVRVRKVYSNYSLLRIASCWSAVIALAGGGVLGGGFRDLQDAWIDLNLRESGSAMQSWFTNESWRSMLAALVVMLDVLWLVQDWTFPGCASTVGTKVFGWPSEQITLSFGRSRLKKLDMCFTSKWLSCFIVMGVLLPLEMCLFAQIAAYAPGKYGLFEDQETFRAFPVNQSAYLSDEYDEITRRILQYGSISRYFPWSDWDCVPAFALLSLGTVGFVWLCAHERFTMRFTAFLGMPAAQEKQRELAKINAALDNATTSVLHTQLRLRALYDMRARSDGFCILLAGVSVLTVVLQFRSIWLSPSQDQVSKPLQSPGETYSVLLLLVTLVLIHQLHHRYTLKMEIMVLKHAIPPECGDALWQSPRRLLLPFLVELAACAFCLPPLLHGHLWLDEERYVVSTHALTSVASCPTHLTLSGYSNRSCNLRYRYPLEVLNMAVFVRLYWFARVVRNSLLKKIVAEPTLVAGGALQSLPVDSKLWSVRVSLTLVPVRLLSALFVFLWVGTAAALTVFERPFPSVLDDEEYSLWLVIETMATVGYGDAYPITGLGRASVFLGAVVGGTVFISLLISVFLESMKGPKHEHKVVETIERVHWERSLRTMAALVIGRAWKRHQSVRDGHVRRSRTAESRLVQAAHRFKLCRKDRPRETFESLRRLEMRTIALWRQHEASEWVREQQKDTQSALAAIEAHVDRIEDAFRSLV